MPIYLCNKTLVIKYFRKKTIDKSTAHINFNSSLILLEATCFNRNTSQNQL